jgi:hypothetical protein
LAAAHFRWVGGIRVVVIYCFFDQPIGLPRSVPPQAASGAVGLVSLWNHQATPNPPLFNPRVNEQQSGIDDLRADKHRLADLAAKEQEHRLDQDPMKE